MALNRPGMRCQAPRPPGVVHPQDEMEVVGKKRETADLDRVERLRPGEGAPRMISFIVGPGRNRRRLWSARQVTSTSAPPSGMKRSRRLMPL